VLAVKRFINLGTGFFSLQSFAITDSIFSSPEIAASLFTRAISAESFGFPKKRLKTALKDLVLSFFRYFSFHLIIPQNCRILRDI